MVTLINSLLTACTYIGACAYMYMHITHACTCMWLATLVISIPLKYCVGFDVCILFGGVRYCLDNAI